MIVNICKRCGIEYTPKCRGEQGRKQKYCSIKCRKDSQKGENHPMYGKHHSEETKEKQSVARIGRFSGDKHPMYGKHHSEETKQKQSSSHLGQSVWNKGISTKALGKSRPITFKYNICEYCGEKYISTQHGKGGEKQRFCSTECKINVIDVWNKGLSSKIDKRILSGDTHPMYIDGRSFLPYCSRFNNELKELIRNRDNRTCQYCGQKESGEKLSVHHIHYDKENCNPDLIALCRVCNIKANTNRNQCEMLFMNKLNERELLFWKRSE